jgi:predicted RNase H-like nuclease
LRHKILEVRRWLPDSPCPVYEVHPEVSFAVIAGSPAASSKKTWAGMVERHHALVGEGIDLMTVDSGTAGRISAVDDMLDAGAVAWSAGRLLRGEARSFPDPPEVDRHGREVAIWA